MSSRNYRTEKLEEKKQKNIEQRLEFVKQWVEYIKNHPDREWSSQQNVVVNSRLKIS